MATIEINGKAVEVENGAMIIEAADAAGIYVPRFCYHKKLSIAANCRMCLVEVENVRKTVPACATPITDGMKVRTNSEAAIRSQQAVMEFLLINHPLDCPICDQGGECELQDLSMGFGSDASEYEYSKRAVTNDDLGPLISTEMTRCIHCTRCVRFIDEVAGVPELGATGRGEDMQIGTYVQHSLTSEVSGNIIDLCPVGALTSKPYRFKARAWEMTDHASIAPHDCLGSHVYIHTRRDQLMRVVPREYEELNETWLSDRDRFSYLGLASDARALSPRIYRNGQWETVDWQTALTFAADGMQRVLQQHGHEQFAAFASPSSTLEEMYLLQKIMRTMGVNNLDHRLQQIDFRSDPDQTRTRALPYAELDAQDNIVLVGCNIHREVPLAGLRVRKANQQGAHIYAINPVDYDYHFAVDEKIIVSPMEMPLVLAKVLQVLVQDIKDLREEVQRLVVGLTPDESAHKIARALQNSKSTLVTGFLYENHPEAAVLRTLVALIAEFSGAHILSLTAGANSNGAWLAGMVPHYGVAGHELPVAGLDIQAALQARLKGYFLLGMEPEFDVANPYGARQSLLAAEFVVALSAYHSDALEDYADVILPIAPYAETAGTYINIDNEWQTVRGAMAPQGEARPAWKILRVLGNHLFCRGFEYPSSEAVLQEIQQQAEYHGFQVAALFYPEALPVCTERLMRIGEWPLYRVDAIVRHADALQTCAAADFACVRVHPVTAKRLHLQNTATIAQGAIEITLPLHLDARIALDTVWVANAMPETVDLGHAFAAITIK